MTIKPHKDSSPGVCLRHVQEELSKAMAVLQILPVTAFDMPGKPRSSWPSYMQGLGVVCGGTRKVIRRKATPDEISHMEYWIELAGRLEEGVRRIVLARAGRIPWRRLAEIDGRSHTTLRKIERSGLEAIAAAHRNMQQDHERRLLKLSQKICS